MQHRCKNSQTNWTFPYRSSRCNLSNQATQINHEFRKTERLYSVITAFSVTFRQLMLSISTSGHFVVSKSFNRIRSLHERISIAGISLDSLCFQLWTAYGYSHNFQLLSALPFELAFWEAINPRGENGQRMLNAGLSFVHEIRSPKAWASYFLRQWDEIEQAAADADCLDRLHIWPDKGLSKYTDPARLQHWWYRPTVEQWSNP